MNEYYELYQQCRLERNLLKEEIQKRDAEIDLYSNAFKTADELRISSAERYDKEIQKRDELLSLAEKYVSHCGELNFMERFVPEIDQWLKQYEELKR